MFLTVEACRSILRGNRVGKLGLQQNAEAVAMWWHQLNYASVEALRPVKRLLDEAAAALNDHAQSTLHETPIPEILGSAVGWRGAATGAGILSVSAAAGTSGAAALTSGLAAAGGVVGGGMIAGIAVVAAPAVVLGIVAYGGTAHFVKGMRLKSAKEAMLQELIKKHDAVLRQLRSETDANAARVESLKAMVAKLLDAIRNLQEDLGEEGEGGVSARPAISALTVGPRQRGGAECRSRWHRSIAAQRAPVRTMRCGRGITDCCRDGSES